MAWSGNYSKFQRWFTSKQGLEWWINAGECLVDGYLCSSDVSRAHSSRGETRQNSISVGSLQSRAVVGHTAGVHTGSHQSGTKKRNCVFCGLFCFLVKILFFSARQKGRPQQCCAMSHILSLYLWIRTGIVCWSWGWPALKAYWDKGFTPSSSTFALKTKSTRSWGGCKLLLLLTKCCFYKFMLG